MDAPSCSLDQTSHGPHAEGALHGCLHMSVGAPQNGREILQVGTWADCQQNRRPVLRMTAVNWPVAFAETQSLNHCWISFSIVATLDDYIPDLAKRFCMGAERRTA